MSTDEIDLDKIERLASDNPPIFDVHYKMTENWLTQKVNPVTYLSSLILTTLLISLCIFYWSGSNQDQDFFAVSLAAITQDHEYWRLWTSLFAHADLGHLISNLMLFIPLTYLLSGYYGVILFPLLGFLEAGLMNLIVIQSMSIHTLLIGISGLVNWMGACWLFLYLLIDKREKFRRRLAVVLFLSLILFAPEGYKPEVSYASHFIGYVLGAVTSILFYFLNYKKIKDKEKYQIVSEPLSEQLSESSI